MPPKLSFISMPMAVATQAAAATISCKVGEYRREPGGAHQQLLLQAPRRVFAFEQQTTIAALALERTILTLNIFKFKN